MVMFFKTLAFVHHRVAISSRIREVRENSRWSLSRNHALYSVLKLYLSICIDLIFDSRVEGGIPSLAAAPDGPDTRPLVSARAAPIILRSSIADLLRNGGVAGS